MAGSEEGRGLDQRDAVVFEHMTVPSGGCDWWSGRKVPADQESPIMPSSLLSETPKDDACPVA